MSLRQQLYKVWIFVTQDSVPRFFNTTGKMSVEPDHTSSHGKTWFKASSWTRSVLQVFGWRFFRRLLKTCCPGWKKRLEMYIYVGMNMAKHFLDVKHFSRCSPFQKICAFWHWKRFFLLIAKLILWQMPFLRSHGMSWEIAPTHPFCVIHFWNTITHDYIC